MSTTYRIAEVAARSGFTPATLRYYEEIGLVQPVARTDAGYRLYDDASLQRLRFIARAKQLGCSLDEIAELSTAWDGGRCAHVQERLRATVTAKVAHSQRQIAELTALTAELQRAAVALTTNTATGACDDTCGCIGDPAPSTVTAVPLVAAPVRPIDAADDGSGDAACGCGGDDARRDEPPIACTLDARHMTGRVEQWATLLGSSDPGSGVVTRHAIDGGVRLELGPRTDVADVARLAAAEQKCCAFFRFNLSIDARGPALEVRAPAEASDLVTALFGAPA
jgi:MerR family copper efflux transcriptional regulator